MQAYTRLFLFAPLFMAMLLPGCAYFSFSREMTPEQQRREQRYDDAGIKTGIASALLRTNAAKANTVSVRCFNGHVFLIGEADGEFRIEAQNIARSTPGVKQVTTHWFPADTALGGMDALLESQIESKVLRNEAVRAWRVSADVWGGHVVLTGAVSNQEQIDGTVARIRQMERVKSVTSYVILQ